MSEDAEPARDGAPSGGTDDARADGDGTLSTSPSPGHSRPRPASTGGRLLRLATHAIQATLVALTGYVLFAQSAGAFLNVALPLAIALMPEYFRRRTRVRLHPGLELWIATAALLHVGGTLGAYQALGWYDQLAHVVSGVLVAGVGYGLVRAVDDQYESVVLPANLRFVFILLFTLAVGALWEVGEFALGGAAALLGGQPLLTQYGLDDVVLDLVFDAAGAVLVAAWGTRYFDAVRAAIGGHLGDEPTDAG